METIYKNYDRHDLAVSKISELKEGDIFKFGKQVWDTLNRFHSIHFYDDKKQKWIDEYVEGCRICFWLMSAFNNDGFKGTFKWSDTNKLDQEIFIPKFYLCEWKKQKGKPCIPHGGHRRIFDYQLSEINISDKYCDGHY